MTTSEIIKRAADAKKAVALSDNETRNRALFCMAEELLRDTDAILAANHADIDAARGTIPDVMLDRLMLNEARISGMAASVKSVCGLPDPTGITLDETVRPNGLSIKRVSVPIGLIAIIYESRPNVTSDAAALTLKSGNACVLRGGREAINSNIAIANALRRGAADAGLPEDSVSLVTDTSRASATELMTARGMVDLLIPRGGAGLIRACVESAKVPCIETGVGICHIYVDADAKPDKALAITDNAKTSRPSVCNAAEVCLVHHSIAPEFLPMLKKRFIDDRLADGLIPVSMRLDKSAYELLSDGGHGSEYLLRASEEDFDTEFLDYIMAVRVVDSLDEAICHIAAHSTGHSEAIVTENADSAARFTGSVDSAAVYVNASTRFTDGGEFGLGCEIGISTQKLHARGPMGLRELTSYKYIIHGDGQIR